MPDLGDVLRRYRERRGWSMGQLALFSGTSKATISKIEANARSPKVETLAAIAEGLEISVDQMLIEAGLLPPRLSSDDISPQEQNLLNVIRSSPTPHFRQRLLEIVTELATVARDADLARMPTAERLRLVAEEQEEYREEET